MNFFYISEAAHKEVKRLAASMEHISKSGEDKRLLCIRSRYFLLTSGGKTTVPYSTTPRYSFTGSQAKKCDFISRKILALISHEFDWHFNHVMLYIIYSIVWIVKIKLFSFLTRGLLTINQGQAIWGLLNDTNLTS